MAKKNKPLLTKKRQQWVDTFKPSKVLRGTPLNYNAGDESRYVIELTALVKQMTAQTQKSVVKLFKTHHAQDGMAMDASVVSQARILMNSLTQKFEQLFGRKADPMATRMMDNTDKSSKSSLHSSLKELSGGLSLKTDVMTGPMKEVFSASVQENVGLIKSIPAQYLTEVQGAVMRSITTGQGLADLIPFLKSHEGMTIRRARNIALDQTRKAYNQLNKGRMAAVGIRKYEWLHTAGSQKPRQLHIQMSGNIYSLDDPPVIDDNTGERGIPGQAINCRCRMVPVIEFSDGVPEE